MACTAREMAEWLGVRLEGDPEQKISGIAAPESAAAEDLIYLDAAKHAERARRSPARAVLTRAELRLEGKTCLLTEDPKLAFARAAEKLLRPVSIAKGIHPTAIIAPSARLAADVAVGPYAVVEEEVEAGAGCEIGAFCFLGAGASLGANCRLYPRVTLYPGVRLGRGVVVHSGAVLGSDGFGYVFGEGRQWKFPQVGGCEIGDDVEIGANTTVDRGALASTRIARGVKLDNLVQVAHNVEIGEHTVVASQTGISGSSAVGKKAVIAGQVGIADHCRIEDGAILGAQAGIPTGKTIRAGQTVWGTPARPLEKFKEQYAWFARLPELAARLRELETRMGQEE